jgi:CheY-like chemotaxis protein
MCREVDGGGQVAVNPGPLVLFVEDEPLIRELGVTAFEDAGFSVLAVATRAEARALIEERAADFAALVTDIDLAAGPMVGRSLNTPAKSVLRCR